MSSDWTTPLTGHVAGCSVTEKGEPRAACPTSVGALQHTDTFVHRCGGRCTHAFEWEPGNRWHPQACWMTGDHMGAVLDYATLDGPLPTVLLGDGGPLRKPHSGGWRRGALVPLTEESGLNDSSG